MECTKVKFASTQAIKEFLKKKKGAGDTSPYFCHECNAFHYTSGQSWKDRKIDKLTEEIKVLTKELNDIKSGKGITQISNTKNMQMLGKRLRDIDDEEIVRAKCGLLKRLYSKAMMIEPPSESQDNEPDHEG